MRRATSPLMLCAALSSAAMLGACEEPTVGAVADGALQEIGADNVVFGMISFMTSRGIREGRVEADTAYMFADSAQADLRGMRIVFYNENGTARATVTGLTGEWDQTTDRMTARGDVVLVVHEDGRKIESPELHYDPNQDRVWSDSATVQVLNGATTRGSSFTSDLGFRNVTIRDIRGGAGRIFNR